MADNSSVVRCRIANSVHQMHEASGRILALATPLCFTRSPRARPGPVNQMTGWLCRQAASMVDGGQVNQVRRPVACRYGAAVPELSAGLPPIPSLPWESLSHRRVLAELAAGGWVPCGVGDWAVALRSPEGTVVARVCPFDPAYRAFVDLCRECAGNRWLPRIELAADLEGGGSVVFLEFAAPVDHAVAEQVAEQWRTAAGDTELEEVRRAAQMIDAGHRKSTPWWGRCDLNEAHIRRAADGRLVLIDVFCMDGASLYRKILEDVAGVHRRIPRERMRYALDIPYIARESSTAEILALKKAWARAAR